MGGPAAQCPAVLRLVRQGDWSSRDLRRRRLHIAQVRHVWNAEDDLREPGVAGEQQRLVPAPAERLGRCDRQQYARRPGPREDSGRLPELPQPLPAEARLVDADKRSPARRHRPELGPLAGDSRHQDLASTPRSRVSLALSGAVHDPIACGPFALNARAARYARREIPRLYRSSTVRTSCARLRQSSGHCQCLSVAGLQQPFFGPNRQLICLRRRLMATQRP